MLLPRLVAICGVLCAAATPLRAQDSLPPDLCDTVVVGDTVLPGVVNSWANSIAFSSWARARKAPTFDEYAVNATFSRTPAPVNFGSAEGARRFRTVLREGAAKGPNFADHYTVITWGCGSPCVLMAIVDADDGHVFMYGTSFVRRPMFRRDSRLLVDDPTGFLTDSVGHPHFASEVRYLEWTGRDLALRHLLDAGVARVVPSAYGVEVDVSAFPRLVGGPPDLRCLPRHD